ncbi:EAL domain-containing protein [Furfurilactobacillus curtus]
MNLVIELTELAIVFLGISATTVGIVFFRTRRRVNRYYDDKKLRYFIQQQVDYQHRVTGYECLLRQQNQANEWVLPQDLEHVPLQRVITLLTETFDHLPDTDPELYLSINLSCEQIMSPEFDYFVRWAVSKIAPFHLAIEFHANRRPFWLQRRHFRQKITAARAAEAKFVVDNVGSDKHELRRIKWLLPVVDMIKCPMAQFRKSTPEIWLDLNLQFWNRLTQEHHIELVLTGIESKQDEALATQLKIKLRQGYLFDRPRDIQQPMKGTNQ